MVFLFLSIIIALFVLILLFSKIQVQIINLEFSSKSKKHINKDYNIIFRLYVFERIPVLKINITKTKMEKIKVKEKVKEKLKDIDIKLIQGKNKFDKNFFKAIKNTNIQIRNINLNIKLGTENAVLTSILVPIISTIIAIFLQKKVNNYENQIFIINPLYINENLINILLSGIFEIKMIHIINIIYILNKKEGVRKYERTSDRRTYDYSYE